MPARPLTAAQKFLIEPLLFSRRTTAYVARRTGLDAEAIEAWRKARHAVRQAARNATRKAQRAAQGKASRVPRGTRPRQTLPAVPASWRRHPADAPLTAAQQAYLEPLVLKRTTTAALARQTGLPAATIEEWRKLRAQAVRARSVLAEHEYAAQTRRLRQHFAEQAVDTSVAEVQVIETPRGSCTMTVWTQGTPCLLPVADYVTLLPADRTDHITTPFPVFADVMGLTRDQNLLPRRYPVADWPSPAELTVLREHAVALPGI
mgnify:CR=1 FL=1